MTDSTTPDRAPAATAGQSNDLQSLYISNPVKACRTALRLTAKEPWKDRLEKCNALLGLHGTEAIRGNWQNGYWCDVVAAYCNTGDSYAVTIIHVRRDGFNPCGRFIVSSMGDWVEKNQRKFGIQ